MAWKAKDGRSGGAGHRRDGSVVGTGIRIDRSRAQAVVRAAEAETHRAAVREALHSDHSWLYADDVHAWLRDKLS